MSAMPALYKPFSHGSSQEQKIHSRSQSAEGVSLNESNMGEIVEAVRTSLDILSRLE